MSFLSQTLRVRLATSPGPPAFARWVLAVILCAAWLAATPEDTLAQKSGSKYKQVELGIDHYDEVTGVYTWLSVRGSTDTAGYRPAEFYWEQYDDTGNGIIGVWGYVAGPVTFSNKPLSSATWTAPMVVYRGGNTEDFIEGTFDLSFTGWGETFYESGGIGERVAVAEGTIFLDLNRNGAVDEDELLDLSHHWARLRGW